MKKSIVAVSSIIVLSVLTMFSGVTNVVGGSFSEGESTFKAKCAPCHGADASGNTAMGKSLKIRDLRSAEVQAQSDAQLFNIISNGQRKMPAYGKSLNQEQINQLVAFIREQAKKG